VAKVTGSVGFAANRRDRISAVKSEAEAEAESRPRVLNWFWMATMRSGCGKGNGRSSVAFTTLARGNNGPPHPYGPGKRCPNFGNERSV